MRNLQRGLGIREGHARSHATKRITAYAAATAVALSLTIAVFLPHSEDFGSHPPTSPFIVSAYVVFDTRSGRIQEAHALSGEITGNRGCQLWHNGSTSQVGFESCLDIRSDPNRDAFLRDAWNSQMHLWEVDLGTQTLRRKASDEFSTGGPAEFPQGPSTLRLRYPTEARRSF